MPENQGWHLARQEGATGSLVCSERPRPPLAAEELRVRVERVCLEPGDFARSGPPCPGGALVGIVEECGEAASAFLEARVLVSPVRACGECPTCRRGSATVCPSRSILGRDQDGGCAREVVASARWLTRLDDGLELDLAQAAFVAGPGLRAYAAYSRAGVSAGDAMIVLGRGPMASVLGALGTGRGAKVLHPDPDHSLAEIAGELPGRDMAERPQVLFVCEGDLGLALELASPGSTLLNLGGTGDIPVAKIRERELMLLGLSFGHPDLLTECAALVAKGELKLAELVRSEKIGADTPQHAARAFAEGKCLIGSHD